MVNENSNSMGDEKYIDVEVELTDEEYAKLERAAKLLHVSVEEYAAKALRDFLDKYEDSEM